jgi:hypothetical protein
LEIVLGMAVAHGPLLSTPPEQWRERGQADEANDALYFRGREYTYAELLEERRAEGFQMQLDPDVTSARHAASQHGVAELAETLAEAAPDIAILIGNDQKELIDDDNLPAFLVFSGRAVTNAPLREELRANRGPGLAVADWAYYPDGTLVHPGHPELGEHLIRSFMQSGFDVAQSKRLPSGAGRTDGIPHAFAFVYRRIMKDVVIPNVPIFINTFYPPNQPSLARCFDFGRALQRAVASCPSDKSVAIIASGGLSHYVIEEDLDRELLRAMQANDESAIKALDDDRFESGTSENRAWVTLAGAMSGAGLPMDLIDYVPCYRTAAGTGQAMGFARWR